jgi:hypothetical protein
VGFTRRLARAKVVEDLERRAKQFRSREHLAMFRVPNEPLLLEAVIDEALAVHGGHLDPDALRARTILRFDWTDDGAWEAWAIALPSGITLFCDADGKETRVLASVKRGSPIEADRFFLELLSESRGEHFGIAMAGGAPDRIRTPIADRDFLIDLFVELFEGTSAERAIHRQVTPGPGAIAEGGRDFRTDVSRWLDRVLVAPPPSAARRKRVKRLRDEEEM